MKKWLLLKEKGGPPAYLRNPRPVVGEKQLD